MSALNSFTQKSWYLAERVYLAGVIHVAWLKGSKDSTHSMDRDELRDLRKLREQVAGLYVFETERGGPLSVDTLQYSRSGSRPARRT